MTKLKQLRQVKKIVAKILEQDTRARNDDKYLYLLVVREFDRDALDYSLELFLTSSMFKDIPCFETVRRTRQSVQASRPELASDKRIEKLRKELEPEYRLFAKDK